MTCDCCSPVAAPWLLPEPPSGDSRHNYPQPGSWAANNAREKVRKKGALRTGWGGGE
jgi:hypothetical protein